MTNPARSLALAAALVLAAFSTPAAAQISGGSCVGYCGTYSEVSGHAQCWCDDACFTYGDCCQSQQYVRSVCYVPTPASALPAAGPTAGNTSLTISGVHFGNAQGTLDLRQSPTGPARQCQAIASWTDSSIVCVTPAGTGAGYQLYITNQWGVSGVSTEDVIFSYDPPIVSSIAPEQVKTDGSQNLTITGSYFGTSGAVVTGEGAALTVVSQTDTQLVVTPPPGQGLNHGLTVNAGGQTSAQIDFGYLAPSIDSVSPAAIPAGGGVITLSGANFGLGGSVTVNGNACTQTSYSQTQVVCAAPAGAGSASIVLTSGLQSDTFPASYGSATITSLSPASGTTAGGFPATLFGQGFVSGTSVSFGGNSIAPGSQTSTQLVFTVPAGEGRSVAVHTVTAGVNSNGLTFNYSPPSITGLLPAGGPTAGGTALTINGSNFGIDGTATVGGAACPTTSNGQSSIVCTTPAGAGAASPVVVTVRGQSSNASPFAYDAPSITTIQPVGAAGAGGSVITLNGSNFGTAPSVQIGSKACPITGVSTQVKITCTLPSGGGTVTASVTSGGQTGTAQYTYASPLISNILPNTADAGGGAAITITGANFGAAPSVTIGPATCANVSASDSTIVCTAPPGVGTSPVEVTASGAMSNVVNFTYAAPQLAGISPSSGPAAGGTVVTLGGSSFGGAPATVNFGDASVTPTVQHDSAITFTTPAGAGGSVQVSVTRGSETTGQLAYTYDAPVIAGLSPASLPWSGGAMVIRGTSFGTSPTVSVGGRSCTVTSHSDSQITCTVSASSGLVSSETVTVFAGTASASTSLAYSLPAVSQLSPATGPAAGGTTLTLGGTSLDRPGLSVNVGSAACTSGHAISAASYQCLTPAGTGSVTVTVVLAAVGAQISAGSFAYAAPSLSSVSPASGPTAGNIQLTLSGSNFGPPGSATVKLGSTTASQVSASDSTIVITQPAGPGGSTTLSVTSGGSTATLPFQFDAPSISSLSPASGSTAGGAVLTANGLNFGDGTLTTVQVGQHGCPLIGASHTQLTCTLPAGEGASQPVVVKVAGIDSGSTPFSYDPPAIASLSPTSLPFAGGALTLSGSNFGTDGAVTVGGVACVSSSRSQTQIVCAAPANLVGPQSVQVTVALQPSNSLSVTYPSPQVSSVQPPSAHSAGGALLLIEGAGFVSPSVTVSGASCPVLKFTPSEIVCTLPAVAAGAAHIVVQSGGLSAQLDGFVVSPTCGAELTDGQACDDGDPCTGDGVCAGSVCRKGAAANDGAACSAGDPCSTAGHCSAGECVGSTAQNDAAECASANPCIGVGTCGSGSCAGSATNEGGACDDGDPATTGDRCVQGVCTGTAAVADAGTPDAGTPDAGTPDAGTPDAGAPDGGSGSGSTGSGCSSSGPAALLALLPLLFWRRRARA